MDQIHIDVTGARQAGIRFDEFPDVLKEDLGAEVDSLSKELFARVQAATPDLTGRLVGGCIETLGPIAAMPRASMDCQLIVKSSRCSSVVARQAPRVSPSMPLPSPRYSVSNVTVRVTPCSDSAPVTAHRLPPLCTKRSL